MVEGFRRFIQSPAGKAVAIVCSICALVLAMYLCRQAFKSDTPDTAFSAMYIDTESGKAFRHQLVLGETSPVVSPYSGRNTGVLAEACYWTASGGTKDEPSWVLLNEATGKPGPTFCPDCGRLVVARNPLPVPGRKPPPTRDEYLARHPIPVASGAPAARDNR